MDGYNEIEEYVVGVEIKTNKVLIETDGTKKDIYRKCFYLAGSGGSINHDITNLDKFTKVEGLYQRDNTTGNYRPLGGHNASNIYGATLNVTSTQVLIENNNVGSYNIFVTLEYTKTN